jgi:LmbE family N-acetylglucosaminyl deacetylase
VSEQDETATAPARRGFPVPEPLADSEVERALVVTAHPDDVDFGAGGTVAAWTSAGIEVSYCICTDGDAGGFDPDVPRDQIAGIRQAEQRAAAKEVGVEDVVFLGYPDGRLTVTHELRRDISRVIRQKRPRRVLIQSPERNWERIYASHPDHLAAGEAAICAVYPDARNPFAHLDLAAEGHEAWTVEEVWVMATGGAPDRWVDVTDHFDRKLAALRAHESQTAHMEDLEGMLRGWLGMNAEAGGLPPGRLAEAFRVISTR